MKKTSAGSIYLFKIQEARKLLPAVSSSDHKASRGRSLLLAGSEQYPGAGILAAQAALRAGSGYVMLAQKSIAPTLENPDFLIANLDKVSWKTLPYDAILVGPGFGVNDFTASVIEHLKKTNAQSVILDADALTVVAQYKLFPLPKTWIVTPHVGELARCLEISSEEINADRPAAIEKARKKFQCVVLLKGDGTLVANSKYIFKIATGNAALAKAGTGDVLAGVITALRAQGLPPTKAALLGAYVHGATANLWKSQKKDLLSMRAVDVIELLPAVLFKIRSGF